MRTTAMRHSTTDSRDRSLAAPHFEMRNASLSQGVLCALAYVVFVLAISATAVWAWPRLGSCHSLCAPEWLCCAQSGELIT